MELLALMGGLFSSSDGNEVCGHLNKVTDRPQTNNNGGEGDALLLHRRRPVLRSIIKL